MTTRVALVTCAQLPDLDSDTRVVAGRLKSHGMSVVPAAWDDPTVEWDEMDLAVVRSWALILEWTAGFCRTAA